MTKPIGHIYNKALLKSGKDRKWLAKRAKLSPLYLGHLLCGSPFYLSERAHGAICKALGISARRLLSLQESQNRRSAKFHEEYNRKKALKLKTKKRIH